MGILKNLRSVQMLWNVEGQILLLSFYWADLEQICPQGIHIIHFVLLTTYL